MFFLKKSLTALSAVTLACCFISCDSDSTSANSNNDDEISSSSVAKESSSSAKDGSSSSVILSGGSAEVEGSSSSSAESSSSDVILSSSQNQQSSSSVVENQSSSDMNLNPSDNPCVGPLGEIIGNTNRTDGSCGETEWASSSSFVESSSSEISSSVIESSSSSSEVILSSSQNQLSSSSVQDDSSSSSSVASNSSEMKTAWDYLNPDIDYGEFTDERDGQVYKTVKICDSEDENCQIWMAQNLNYAYTGVKFDYEGYTSDSTSWCSDNNASNCNEYGRLYTWSAVMDSVAKFSVNAGTECGYDKTCTPNSPHRGICPEGWHVPNDDEWKTLVVYVGETGSGKKLKSIYDWKVESLYMRGNDAYGFSALPVGCRFSNGEFSYYGYSAYFWSSSEYNNQYAPYLYFYSNYSSVRLSKDNKYEARSVRCLKD